MVCPAWLPGTIQVKAQLRVEDAGLAPSGRSDYRSGAGSMDLVLQHARLS